MGGLGATADPLNDIQKAILMVVFFAILLIVYAICTEFFRHDERRYTPNDQVVWSDPVRHPPPSYSSFNQTRYVIESEVRSPTRSTSYAQAVHVTQRAASQRAASQKVASHRTILSRREVHFFVQRLVELFKDQRRDGYQFAVLCLSHQRNFTAVQFQTGVRTVYRPDRATDKSSATFPSHKNLYNYIVARPDGPDHAEAILISRFDTLLRSYQSLNMHSPCRIVVLYTWLLPCEYCTRQIIGRLGQGQSSPKVVVIYTSKMQDVTDQQERETVRRLEEAGITVIQETYDKYLPPA